MKKCEVFSLDGWPLRWAVAKVMGRAVFVSDGRVTASNKKTVTEYRPDLLECQYDLLAFRHSVTVEQVGLLFVAEAPSERSDGRVKVAGLSKGAAICRAIVMRYAGDSIEVPSVNWSKS